ncbi:MAG: hypothetical protein ACR2PR_12820 [Pseudohongiellaceae bacterium]
MSNKFIKWPLIGLVALLLIYVGWIVYYEARLGYRQPQSRTSMTIATFNDGDRHERVLRLEQIDGKNYIAANHWPRAWYNQALDNPEVEVKMPGTNEFAPYTAVPLEGAELEQVSEIYRFGFNFRFRTGFPPRRFMRLDPR